MAVGGRRPSKAVIQTLRIVPVQNVEIGQLRPLVNNPLRCRYSMNSSLLRISTNSGRSRIGSEKTFALI